MVCSLFSLWVGGGTAFRSVRLCAVIALTVSLSSCTFGTDDETDEAEASTTVAVSVASGSGERGATAADCGTGTDYVDDVEFQVAVCEVELAIAASSAPDPQWERRLAEALADYGSDRDGALEALFSLAEEIGDEE